MHAEIWKSKFLISSILNSSFQIVIFKQFQVVIKFSSFVVNPVVVCLLSDLAELFAYNLFTNKSNMQYSLGVVPYSYISKDRIVLHTITSLEELHYNLVGRTAIAQKRSTTWSVCWRTELKKL